MLITLFESAVRSITVAAVLGVAVRMMRIRNPQTLSIVWRAVLFCALMMPLLMLAMKAVMVSAPPEAVSWIPNASPSPFFLRPLSSTADNSISLIERATKAIMIVYAIVALVALFRIGLGLLRGYQLRRGAIRLNEMWTSGWDIRASTQLALPVTYGRTVLLPAEWPKWSDFRRDAILIHETSHVRRRDFYVQLLAAIHRAVFWFSPLAWWLQDQLLKASENACDDEAIARVGDRASYAELLLDLTKLCSNDRLWGVAMARGKTVGSRVERILRETRIAPRISVARRVFIIAGMVPLVAFAAGAWIAEAETKLSLPSAPPAIVQQVEPITLAAAVQQQPGPDPALDAGALANWIENEVPDIAAAEEQAAFNALRNDEERKAFIEQFWSRRDPTPATAQNEFRDEYYRRVAVASQRYSTATTNGWKTDRGRTLVKFGEADEVESHLTPPGALSPFEKWRYRAIVGIGQEVILEFVDVGGNGDYRLTSEKTSNPIPPLGEGRGGARGGARGQAVGPGHGQQQ